MNKVIFRTALTAVIVVQSGCAPIYKGLWLDKVFETEPAFLNPVQTAPVPVAPRPVARAPVATASAVRVPVAAAPAPQTTAATTALVVLQTSPNDDKSDRQLARGPSSSGGGSGPAQVALDVPSRKQGPVSSGTGSGPSQAARRPSRNNR